MLLLKIIWLYIPSKILIRLSVRYLIETTLQMSTVKLGFKELLNKEQIGISEPFFVTNLPVYLINSDQIGIKAKLF